MSSLVILTEEEEKVYDAIQHYVNNNRVLNCEKLVSYISNKFSRSSTNINEKGIRSILDSLIQKKIIAQGSKLTKSIVLQNLNRRIIYDFIKKNPGYYVHRLIKTLELPNHVITWHLEVLLRFGYIKKTIIENHDVFFHPKVRKSNYKVLYALSKPKIQKILSLLFKNQKPMTKTAIAKNLSIHYNTVSKYINLLRGLNLIQEEKLTHKTLYQLNQNFFDFLSK